MSLLLHHPLSRALPVVTFATLLGACDAELVDRREVTVTDLASRPAPRSPGYGNVIVTSADTPRESPLPEPDDARLAQLHAISIPQLASAPSPDGGMVVVDVRDGSFAKQYVSVLHLESRRLQRLPAEVDPDRAIPLDDGSLFGWRGPREVAYLETASAGLFGLAAPQRRRSLGFWPRPDPQGIAARASARTSGSSVTLVTIEVSSGQITRQPIALPGLILAASARLDQALVSRDNDGESELLLVELSSGAASSLGLLEEGQAINAVKWSPDGSRVALLLGHAIDEDLGPFFGESGPSRLLSSLGSSAVQDSLGRLSPDRNPSLRESRVRVHDTRSRRLVQTIEPTRRLQSKITRIAWSPSGRSLMLAETLAAPLAGRRFPLADGLRGRIEIVLRSVPEGRERLRLTDPEPTRVVSAPLPMDDDSVLVTVRQGMDDELVRYRGATRQFETLASLRGTSSEARLVWDAARGRALFTSSSFATPAEVAVLRVDSREIRTLTQLHPGVSELASVRAERVAFTLRDGERRHGYWVAPAAAAFPPTAPQPLVVWQLGGPGFSMANEWSINDDSPATALAAMGLPVLVVPLAGRFNHGPRAEAALFDQAAFGQRDIDEAAQIVRQLIERGWVAPSRVGITGCSYGGYFAAQSAATFPSLYAAANPQCGIYDFLWGWQFDSKELIGLIMGKTASEAPHEYLRDSPLYQVDRMRAPMLISHGDLDSLPVHAAQQLHDELVERGRQVTLLRFSDEAHGLNDRSNNLFGLSHQLAFFRRHLLGQ